MCFSVPNVDTRENSRIRWVIKTLDGVDFDKRYSIIYADYLGYKFCIPLYPWEALAPYWASIAAAISKILIYERFSPECYKDHHLWRENRMGLEALRLADFLTRDRDFRRSVREFNAQVTVMKYGDNWIAPFDTGQSEDFFNHIAQLGQLIYNSVKFLRDTGYLLVYGELVKVIRPYWCFEEGTEVLTDAGWKNMADLTYKDSIATRSPNGFLEYQKPSRIIKRWYDGEIVRFRTHEIDLGVTPEHRAFARESWISDYKFIIAQDMTKTEYRIPRTCKGYEATTKKAAILGGKRVDFLTYVDFMAAWLSEGWTHHQREVQIAQKNKVDLIRAILSKMPFRVVEKKRKDGMTIFTIYSAKLAKELREYGTKASDKRIPNCILNADRNIAQRFLDLYIQFDGEQLQGKKSLRKKINTTSKRLADDLQELEFKAGRVAKIYLRKVQGFKEHSVYRLSENIRTTDVCIKKKNITKERYTGYVHCVTVRNGVILVRNKGKFCWSGNCPPAEWALNRDWGLQTCKFILKEVQTTRKGPALRKIAEYWKVPRYTLIEAGFTMDVIRDMYRHWRKTGEIKIIKPPKEYKMLSEEEQKQMAVRIAKRIYH